jgi:hypothetical protein
MHSFPDVDDTVVALLRDPNRPADLVLLVDKVERARKRLTALGLVVAILEKRSRAGVWAYLRSRVCVSTHGMYGSRRRGIGKRSVTTWHGELGKMVGRAALERSQFYDRVYATNGLSKAWRSAEFGVNPNRVLLTGQARNQLLERRRPSSRYMVWAPTYRIGTSDLKRRDGDQKLLETFMRSAFAALQPILEREDVALYVRMHPAAATMPDANENVHLATDEVLEAQGVSFYEFLAGSEALLTDYSSIWFDYLVVSRPMIAATPDLSAYLADRSMSLGPFQTWFPGDLAETPEQLVAAVADVLEGKDRHAERRQWMRDLLHPDTEIPPAEAIWADVATLSFG